MASSEVIVVSFLINSSISVLLFPVALRSILIMRSLCTFRDLSLPFNSNIFNEDKFEYNEKETTLDIEYGTVEMNNNQVTLLVD